MPSTGFGRGKVSQRDVGAFGVDDLPLGPPTTHYQSQGGGLRVRLWGAAQSPHSRSLFGAGGVTPTTTHYRSQGGGLRERAKWVPSVCRTVGDAGSRVAAP
jgi:hypothetical protein